MNAAQLASPCHAAAHSAASCEHISQGCRTPNVHAMCCTTDGIRKPLQIHGLGCTSLFLAQQMRRERPLLVASASAHGGETKKDKSTKHTKHRETLQTTSERHDRDDRFVGMTMTRRTSDIACNYSALLSYLQGDIRPDMTRVRCNPGGKQRPCMDSMDSMNVLFKVRSHDQLIMHMDF